MSQEMRLAKDHQACPRGSVALVKGNTTRLAARSSGQKKGPKKKSGPGQWGSHTSIFISDLGTLQQWRFTQGAWRVELRRLQHRFNFIGKEEQACRPGSDPLPAIWTPWTAAAAQKLQRASCPQVTTPAYSHVPCASPAGRMPQSDSQPRQRSQSRRDGLSPQFSLPRRALLLLSVTNGTVKKQKKHREHHRHQRRCRPRRTMRSETTEDTSSTSSNERMRRERRAQKYTSTTYCEVTLAAAVTSFFRLHLSTPLYASLSYHIHDRDPHQ